MLPAASPVGVKREENEELEARLRYLRETGAPMYYIEEVARQAVEENVS